MFLDFTERWKYNEQNSTSVLNFSSAFYKTGKGFGGCIDEWVYLSGLSPNSCAPTRIVAGRLFGLCSSDCLMDSVMNIAHKIIQKYSIALIVARTARRSGQKKWW